MLFIEQSVLHEMINWAESRQEECCGFFFGHELIENKVITKSIFVNNAEQGDKSTNFEITPKDYILAEDIATQENLSLLGIYHSHPNFPAIPSEYDLEAAQPNFSYIILSVIDKKFAAIRSWQLDPYSEFKEEKIEVIPV
jgi:proteasome lid subunit RPN8/RPN11